jgi:hypothetical protein
MASAACVNLNCTELSNRPATFIIDRDGVHCCACRAETFADRPSAAEIAEVLENLQATASGAVDWDSRHSKTVARV